MSQVDAEELLHRNVEELRDLLAQTTAFGSQIASAAEALAKALLRGGKLLACGNGGSASEASHLTTEFVCRYNRDRRPYPAISLATHGGDLTAIGNDYEFNDIFARQVEAFGRPGDVLVTFSTSGKSENIRRALLTAKKKRLLTISFLGRDGGRCAALADIEYVIHSETTARIQEMHQLLLHTMCEMAEEQLQANQC
jgi:D-sedoheptulose 7-phosphate isomerase